MKKIITLIIMALTAILTLDASPDKAPGHGIVVMSDTHLLAPELITPGNASRQAEAAEVKMTAMSDSIVSALIDSIITWQPQTVLITGDLTHNGERASHERMARHLQRLASHGIQALVIPGNHDCNNPFARRYDGDHATPAATVTREEFAAIYRDYGYSEPSQRDTASLSYCRELADGLMLIAIDSNNDEQNTLTSRGDSADTYHNGGRIKAQTLQWVIERAAQARSRDMRVVAMMHHHLIPHFDQEDRLLANYIIEDHDNAAQQLMQAGIHAIFTGHLHVTDAASLYNNEYTDSITEVATGSTICYPFAVRVCEYDSDKCAIGIGTRWLTATAGCPTLREQGRNRIINATPAMAQLLASKVWNAVAPRMGQIKRLLEMGGGTAILPETPQQASSMVLHHLSEALSHTMLAVMEGNEGEHGGQEIIEHGQQGLRAIIDEIAPDGEAGTLWDFFTESVYPRLEPIARSILEDRNAVGTAGERVTDDLNTVINL